MKSKFRYCKPLECIGTPKGADLNQILEAINSKLCNPSGNPIYSFEYSDQCENGGFLVKENGEEIFSFCQECCESGYEYIRSYSWINSDRSIGGNTFPIFSNLTSKLAEPIPTIVIPKTGKYKLTTYIKIIPQDPGNDYYIGVMINGNQPTDVPSFHLPGSTDTTYRDTRDLDIYTITYSFIFDANENDEVDLGICMISGLINFDGRHRMILEKIG